MSGPSFASLSILLQVWYKLKTTTSHVDIALASTVLYMHGLIIFLEDRDCDDHTTLEPSIDLAQPQNRTNKKDNFIT